jgi:antitoxin component YwqK of YwqJK toxin-antitoxin module
MKYRINVVLCSFLFISPILAADSINEKNWMTHPQIVKIRGIVQEIDASIDKNRFDVKTKQYDLNESPDDDHLRTVYFDSKQIIRKYIRETGSDDSSVTLTHYYDSGKVLRFLYIKAGAVNGTSVEYRIYFDESGKKIWEIKKQLKGPGYTFPSVWPDDQILFDPARLPL